MLSRTRTGRARALAGILATLTLGLPCLAQSSEFDTELLEIQHAWDEATYRSANADAKRTSLEALSHRAETFAHQHGDRAEPLIWQGIVLSSYAGAKGGLGALSLAKKARDSLQGAMKVDPQALNGSAYTSLGALYYKVPGFPLGFGDRRKAGDLLREALAVNPDGIDPNFFYGEWLFEQGDYPKAAQYLQKALAAPPRAARPLADSGRRAEVTALLARVREKMSDR